ncbi:MAG: protein translocase subunit SecD [Planctomycetes bacterium]|nr:protein translocase subunit SecD [Planctomycetota bacterium]
MYKKTGWGFAITALILGLAIYTWFAVKPQLGIDLQGGTELIYQLDLKNLEYSADTAHLAETVKDLVAGRLDGLGLKEIFIATQGSDRIVVQLPGADSQTIENYRRQIEEAGNLDFMLVAADETQGRLGLIQEAVRKYNQEDKAYWDQRERDPAVFPKPPEKPEALRKLDEELAQYRQALRDWNDQVAKASAEEREKILNAKPAPPEWVVYPHVEIKDMPGGGRKLTHTPGRYTVLNFSDNYKVSGKYLSRAYETMDNIGRPAIGFEFSPFGANLFSDLTGGNIKRYLAIVLDGRLVQSPVINSRIAGRGIIEGDFNHKDVEGVVNILRGGSLPTKPLLVSESTIGSLLGQESVRQGAVAVISGLIAVFIFMVVYYWIGGMIANAALFMNIVLIMAYVLVFRQTLTFPGIAGILLTIGMAVDANILIFERVREELAKGKSLPAALGTGYQRAFWVIFDSNLTTILSAVVLFEFGTGPVKGFAVTLIAGILASFFTAVYVTRLIFSFLLNIKVLKSLRMLHLIKTPRVDYIGHQKKFIGLSLAVIGATWALFVIPRGLENYGIDFTGGTKVTMSLSRTINKTELDQAIDGLQGDERALFTDYSLQTLYAKAPGVASEFILTTRSRKLARVASAQEAGKESAGLKAVEVAETVDQDYILVRRTLEKILKERQLILPDPYPKLEWVASGTEKQLQMELNLIFVHSDLADNPDRLKELLNRHLQEAFRPSENFKGIQVAELKHVDQTVLEPASGRKITRYALTTTGYQPPEPTAEAAGIPRPLEVEDAVKKFFKGESAALRETLRGGRYLSVSDPFPEVLTIGPRVASNLQAKAIIAMFISIVAIVFYLALRFEFTYGLGAITALIHDVFITIGIFAMTDLFFGDLLSFKINLPEIASIMTVIGFSVNDTIVIFDRIRENLTLGRKWSSFEDLVNASVNQTLSRTIWTSGTAILVTLTLLTFGGESIKGFAFIFTVGVITGTYSSVFIASPVMIYLRKRAALRRERLAQLAAATA